MPQDAPDWSRSQSTLISTGSILAGAIAAPFDVSRFDSVIIKINSLNSGILPALVCQMLDQVFNVIDQFVASSDRGALYASFAMPVVGPWLQLANDTGQTVFYTVYGVARQLPRGTLGNYFGTDIRSVVVANGTASGTFTRLVSNMPVAGLADNSVTSFNGQVFQRFAITALGGATQWLLYAGYVGDDGNRIMVPIREITAAGASEVECGHPMGYVSWWVQNTGLLTGAVTASLTTTPAS